MNADLEKIRVFRGSKYIQKDELGELHYNIFFNNRTAHNGILKQTFYFVKTCLALKDTKPSLQRFLFRPLKLLGEKHVINLMVAHYELRYLLTVTGLLKSAATGPIRGSARLPGSGLIIS